MTPEQIQERENRLRRAFVNNDFGGASGLLSSSPMAGMVDDPNSFLMSSAVAGWAGSRMGRRINPASPEWQGIKDGIARGYFKEREAANITDDQLFAKIAADYRAQEAVELAARQAASRGKSWLASFRELESASEMPAGRQAQYLGLARVVHDQVADKIAPYRGIIGRIVEMGGQKEDESARDFDAMTRELLTVPPEDRRHVLEALALQASDTLDEGAIQNIAVSWGRALDRYLVQSFEGIAPAILSGVIPESDEPQTPEDIQLDQQQQQEFDDYRNLRDDLRDIANGVFAPVEKVKFMGMDLTAATESLPMTLGAMVPYAGPASMVGFFQRETSNELRRKHPEMDAQSRELIATASAPIQALVEVVSDRLLFGRLPNLKRAFSNPVFTASGIAGQFAGRLALGTGTEYAEEFAQGLTPLAFQEIFGALQKDVPDVDWKGYFSEFGEMTPELLSGIVPLVLLGAGVGQVSDYRAGKRLASDPTMLQAAGYTQEAAESIATEAKAGNWAKAQDLMRAGWAEVNQKAEPVSAVAQEARAKVQAARAEAAAKVTQDTQADVEMGERLKRAEGVGVPRIRRDAQGWMVEDQESGGMIRVRDFNEAVGMAYAGLNDLDRKSAEATAQLADEFMRSSGGNAEAFDIRMQEMDAKGLVGAGIVTAEQMQAGIDTYAAMHGLTPEESANVRHQVFGFNKAELIDGVKGRVSYLFGGGNLMTAIEEGVHGRWNAGLENGTFTQAQGLAWVRMAENATGTEFLPTRDDASVSPLMLDEAISAVVQADIIGRRKDGKRFAPGLISRGIAAFALSQRAQAKEAGKLATFLKAWREFWGQVLRAAKAMKRARAEGKLGEDFDAFLDQLLGADAQQRYEGQVNREVEALAEQIAPENMPFSLAPVTPETWQKEKSAVAARRQEIITEFNEDQQNELTREIEGFGTPPTVADIYTEDTGDQQFETALWKYRHGKAAGYAVSRYRERDDENSPWGDWTKWMGYKPDSGDPDETFNSADEAIQWLRTQPLEDAGEDIGQASTYLSERRRLSATYDLIKEIALPPGWTLDRAQDSQWGSKYWEVRGPLEPPNNDDDERAFHYKLSIRSHEPSPAREAQFGAVDFYVPLAWEQGNAINTVPLELLSSAMERLEDWMWKKHQSWAAQKNQDLAASRAVPSTEAPLVAEMPDGAQLYGPALFSIRAYHGTPHKVDKFTTAKIGTGEGAQAYGWGLYFAESRDVGEQYRKTLSTTITVGGKQLLKNNQKITSTGDSYVDDLLIANDGDLEAAIASERAYADSMAAQGKQSRKTATGDPYETLNKLIALQRQQGVDAQTTGNLYTVELLTDEADFLDWDKPLSEQSEKVKAALGGYKPDAPDVTGSQVYMDFAFNEGDEKTASERLASLGIPGIKYLDAGSRGAGDGTRNFVIFDENLVRILEENGKPVEAASFSMRAVTPEQDAEYMAAVEAGDMAKAQAMVDEAAKAAGYDNGPWLHGSKEKIQSFDVITADDIKGFYFTKDPKYARLYGENQHRVFLNVSNTLDIRPKWSEEFLRKVVSALPKGAISDKIDLSETVEILDEGPLAFGKKEFSQYEVLRMLNEHVEWTLNRNQQEFAAREGGSDAAWLEAARLFPKGTGWQIVTNAIQSLGYDSVLRQEYSGALSGATTAMLNTGFDPESIVVFYPSQIKSADPVTRDDSGNVIPLSQRFNPETPDIRFSIGPAGVARSAESVLESYVRAPKARETFFRVARERLAKLREGGPMRVDRRGRVSQSEGLDAMSDRVRTPVNIDAERKFRFRSRQRELIDQGMEALTPETIAAYSEGLTTLENQPLIKEMISRGKLMSKATAQRLGKLKADGKGNAGDYDSAPWLPPAWYAKGDSGYMPDRMARELYDAGLLNDASPDELWSAIESAIKTARAQNESVKKAQSAVRDIERNAEKQARDESNAWAQEEKAKVPTPKERQIAALRMLDAILSAFPAEIRGKVGGYVQLAKLGTDEARAKEIARRIEMLDKELERWAKEHYAEKVEKLLKRYGSKVGATGRLEGKAISTVTEIIDFARGVKNASIEEQADMATALEARAIDDALTDDQRMEAIEKIGILRMFEMWDDKPAESAELAAGWLEETAAQGVEAKKMLAEDRRAMLAEMKGAALADVQDGAETSLAEANNETNAVRSKTLRKIADSLKSYTNDILWTTAQQLEIIFGEESKISKVFQDRIISAANESTDIKRRIDAERKAALAGIFSEDNALGIGHVRKIGELQKARKSGVMVTVGRKVETVKLDTETLTKLSDGTMTAEAAGLREDQVQAALEEFAANERKRTVEVEKVTNSGRQVEKFMSEAQGMQYWLWWQQARSRKQMERDGWTEDSFNQLESFLSPQAVELAKWMAVQYDAAADLIDPVYRRLFNAPLPRHKNYSPVYRVRNGDASNAMDIDGGSQSSDLMAGFTKAADPRANSPLQELDAISVFLTHWEHVAHWVTHAELVRDLKAVLLDRDVVAAIRQKAGDSAAKGIKTRVASIETQGNRSAWELHGMNTLWNRFTQFRAFRALAFKLSPVLKQFSAFVNPLLADVPAHSYAYGMARAFLNPDEFASSVAGMFKSDIIQRRIQGGFSAEARLAKQGEGVNGSVALALMQKGMMPMGYTDGGWTALGAAVAYDYYKRRYMKANPGATPEVVESEATMAVERMISVSAQPADFYNRALIENSSNVLVKNVWMFATDQRKALAIEAMALRKLIKGKGSAMDVQRFVVAHFLQAAMTQTVAMFLAVLLGDDEDKEREWSVEQWGYALAAGPINGLFVFGRGIDSLLRRAFGLRVFSNSTLAESALNDIVRGTKAASDLSDDPTGEEVIRALDGLSTATAATLAPLIGPQAGAVDVLANIAREAEKLMKE